MHPITEPIAGAFRMQLWIGMVEGAPCKEQNSPPIE